MAELTASVNTIVPLLLLAVLGVVLKKWIIKGPEFYSATEKLVFKVALPCSLFMNIYNADAGSAFNGRLIIFCVCGIALSFIIPCLLTPLFIKSDPKRGAFIQGVGRTNFALVGLPLAQLRFGAAGEASVSSVMPFAVPMFNILAVIVLSVFAPSEKKLTVSGVVKKSAIGIVTNPLIIGIVLGLPFMLTSLTLPTAVTSAVKYCGNMATPLSLICLGASMGKGTAHSKLKLAVIATAIKVLITPFVLVAVAVLIGFRGIELGAVVILFGGPTAVSSYIMAKGMDSDHELAGKILLLTTVFCSVTLFVGFYALAVLGLI